MWAIIEIIRQWISILIHCLLFLHYNDVIMITIASQITSLTVVYSTVYSDADQRKHQSSASLAFVWGIHRDRWIPRTKGQLRGKYFHLMTSSWSKIRFIIVRSLFELCLFFIIRSEWYFQIIDWATQNNDVTWASWCVKSPAIQQFVKPFVQTCITENIKASHYCPLRRESTGRRLIPITKGQ